MDLKKYGWTDVKTKPPDVGRPVMVLRKKIFIHGIYERKYAGGYLAPPSDNWFWYDLSGSRKYDTLEIDKDEFSHWQYCPKPAAS